MICKDCSFLNKKVVIKGFYKCNCSTSVNPISRFPKKAVQNKYKWTYCSDFKPAAIQLEFDFS